MDVPNYHFSVLNELKKKTASSGDLPPPERLYGKAIHDAKTPAQQRQEATRLFEFLYNSDGDTPVLGVLGLDPIHKTPL